MGELGEAEYGSAAEMRAAYAARIQKARPYQPVKLQKALTETWRLKPSIAPPAKYRVNLPVLTAKHSTAILTLTDQEPELLDIRRRLSVSMILFQVAQAHGVLVADLLGGSRRKTCTYARFHAVAALRQHRPDISNVKIGQALGQRDPSTILHALKQWPKHEKQFPRQVTTVETRVKDLTRTFIEQTM
jgi:hypothetical protein